jgi:hypothetical protein
VERNRSRVAEQCRTFGWLYLRHGRIQPTRLAGEDLEAAVSLRQRSVERSTYTYRVGVDDEPPSGRLDDRESTFDAHRGVGWKAVRPRTVAALRHQDDLIDGRWADVIWSLNPQADRFCQ